MHLNQYYTEDRYGDLLIRNLSLLQPKIALDLGFGTGNLLNAARRRWSDLSLVGIDIDNNNVAKAISHSSIQAFELNGFDPFLPEIINERFGDIDLLVGNPPYFSRDLDQNAKRILDSVGMLECVSNKIKKIPAELIFIAQNLRLLSKKGELGLIVPAGIISGEKWKPVREFLFSNYHVTNVIQLPTDSFKNTDAQTFILIIKHKSSPYNYIPLSHINSQLTLKILPQEAFHRADYSYHQKISEPSSTLSILMNDFHLYRGNKSHNELSIITNQHLHTTNLPDQPQKISCINTHSYSSNMAKSGDILVARVGRRCLGRVAYVEKGYIPVSDCIIGIRPVNQQIGQMIWSKLSTSTCRDYFSQVALGVGAKYITYKTITDYLTTGSHAST